MTIKSQIMFPRFTIWKTRDDNDQAQPVSIAISTTKSSRRARASPYPMRLVPTDDHPLEDSRKPLRSKVSISN
jgi:hypothetical protein